MRRLLPRFWMACERQAGSIRSTGRSPGIDIETEHKHAPPTRFSASS